MLDDISGNLDQVVSRKHLEVVGCATVLFHADRDVRFYRVESDGRERMIGEATIDTIRKDGTVVFTDSLPAEVRPGDLMVQTCR